MQERMGGWGGGGEGEKKQALNIDFKSHAISFKGVRNHLKANSGRGGGHSIACLKYGCAGSSPAETYTWSLVNKSIYPPPPTFTIFMHQPQEAMKPIEFRLLSPGCPSSVGGGGVSVCALSPALMLIGASTCRNDGPLPLSQVVPLLLFWISQVCNRSDR